jgi:hypothetical protein
MPSADKQHNKHNQSKKETTKDLLAGKLHRYHR